MRVVNAPKLIVDALLQRFLPLARRRVDTAQAQVSFRFSAPCLRSAAVLEEFVEIGVLEVA
jgi:hypothetical protein